MTNNQGFTLIELLIVISIIAILAGLMILIHPGVFGRADLLKGLRFSQGVHSALGVYAVGIWDFNEGAGNIAYDASGRGNHGTIHGASWTSDTPTREGFALDFDGSNDYVDYGVNIFSEIIDRNPVSVFTWINLSNRDKAYTGIFGNSQGGTSITLRFHFGTYYSNNEILYLRFIIGDGTEFTSITRNMDSVQNGEWHYVGITWDGTTATLYLNGNQLGDTRTITRELASSTASWKTGRAFSSSSYSFPGLIDDVRIYSEALVLSEIREIYYAGLDKLLAQGQIDQEEYNKRHELIIN